MINERRRYVPLLALGFLSSLTAVELTVRGLSPILPRPLFWYSQFAEVKVAEMERHRGEPSWAAVVFAGDSTVGRAFSPQLFAASAPCDLPAYNAAIPGATPRILEHWVGEVVVPRLEPAVVALGFTSRALNGGGGEGAERAYFSAPAVRADLGARIERWSSRYSFFVRYRYVLRSPIYLKPALARLLPGIEPEEPWERPTERGYPSRREAGAPYRLGEYAFAERTSLRDFEVGAEQLRALRRTIDQLRERQVATAIVDMPVSEDYPELHPRGRGDYEAYREAIRRLADAEGATFVDLTHLRDRSLFEDPVHLNRQGATTASRDLAAALALPACRSQPAEP